MTKRGLHSKKSAATHIVIIGDIVASRRLKTSTRRSVQQHLLAALKNLNRSMSEGLLAEFTITLGDEFEGVLRPEVAGTIIPDLLWTMEKELAGVPIRFGIGMGGIDTEIVRSPLEMDGPAFHAARTAIDAAAAEEKMGGVFMGFGCENDLILNGMARLLYYHRNEWSPQQRRVANLLREGKRKHEAADILNLTRQAVSAYARAADWAGYAEGEAAWHMALAVAANRMVAAA
ncbi:MAG TPA: SatD family protein [Terracidiphilus sp.]